jgi:TM2 domain-containing membrane protein YozV
MRKSTIAALMSVVIPGAGLFYCGRVRSALANLVIALAVPLVAVWAGFPGEHVLWLILAIAAGSAGFAHAAAEKSFSVSE